MSRSPDDDVDLPQDLQDSLAAAVRPAELGAEQRDRCVVAPSSWPANSRRKVPARCEGARARGSDRAVAEVRELRRDEAAGTHTSLMRMRPGGTIPAHRHEREEEFIILEGECYIGTHRLVAATCTSRRPARGTSRSRPKAALSFCYEGNIRIRRRRMTYWVVTKLSQRPGNCARCVCRPESGCCRPVTLLPSLALGGGIPTATDGSKKSSLRASSIGSTAMPISASVGIVTSEQLDLRPVLRTGELLEVVPGLIVTQHSGDGKANQYFLRGFNLDHGTDLATSVDGVPVNMPTHAHGQGYTDINFVIPELVAVDRVSQGHVLRRRPAISPRPAR